MFGASEDLKMKKAIEEKEKTTMINIKRQIQLLHGNKRAMMEGILEDVFKEGRFPIAYMIVFAKPGWVDEHKFEKSEEPAPDADYTIVEHSSSTISKYSSERFEAFMVPALKNWAEEQIGAGPDDQVSEYTLIGKF